MTQMEFGSLTDTLKDERERIMKERGKGTHCLACGQFAKVYHRQIHSSIAIALIGLYRLSAKLPSGEYVHTTEISKFHPACVNGRCELPMARWWGLIEEKPMEEDGSGKSSGLWRLTTTGRNFVRGELRVPRQLYIYNNEIFGRSHDGDEVVIEDCLKKKFNYQELMAS